MKISYLLLLLLIGLFPAMIISEQVSIEPESRIQQKIDSIRLQPYSLTFQNSLDLPAKGGHIQGIQKMIRNESEYYIVTGSSSSYSYYSILKKDKVENRLITIQHILGNPFRHAGGFQINKNLMAIGVEDNQKKNRSKVLIYEVNNPESIPAEPWITIDRFGTSKRATAGCVAITELDKKVIIIVGDWDTVNLDFYVIERKLIEADSAALTVEYTINTRTADKSDWIDEAWLSYQNINLLQDKDGEIWLAGTATNMANENILDLYKLTIDQFKVFSLTKIISKNFGFNPDTSFRWGAGVYISGDQSIQILATPENIDDQTTIYIYD